MNVLPIVRSTAWRRDARPGAAVPNMKTVLEWHDEVRALAMFRDELRDTKEIAWRLGATEAAVANGIARARERGRRI
jgi:hypothetical protein